MDEDGCLGKFLVGVAGLVSIVVLFYVLYNFGYLGVFALLIIVFIVFLIFQRINDNTAKKEQAEALIRSRRYTLNKLNAKLEEAAIKEAFSPTKIYVSRNYRSGIAIDEIHMKISHIFEGYSFSSQPINLDLYVFDYQQLEKCELVKEFIDIVDKTVPAEGVLADGADVVVGNVQKPVKTHRKIIHLDLNLFLKHGSVRTVNFIHRAFDPNLFLEEEDYQKALNLTEKWRGIINDIINNS
ncbi:MAG: hypothetical protein LBK69_04220 [Syntrophomonadaceae bacterium]|jgi:hypothetical protein|nr:hypothetical protein [Syntrophomonadaceae bacterium]